MIVKKGDIVEIIAPASFNVASDVSLACKTLNSWGLEARSMIDFEAYHPFHSDEDEVRFLDLTRALYAPDSSVIWCLRGGYGSARLIERLLKLKKPKKEKMLIGYSDITSLHLFLNQKWGWKTIHGPMISSFGKKDFNKEAFSELKKILFGKSFIQKFKLSALNDQAERNNKKIIGSLCGGNLSVIQASLGTSIEIKTKGKILLLEDIGERGYKLDKMLNHLKNSKALDGCKAIILGEFIGGLETSGESFVDFALTRFAMDVKIPVFKNQEFGHGETNRPFILNGVKKSMIEKKQLVIND